MGAVADRGRSGGVLLSASGRADRAAAGGIALIGTGNLGGFVAPNLKVWADGYFGSPHAGRYLLAGLSVVNAGLIALIRIRGSRPNVQ